MSVSVPEGQWLSCPRSNRPRVGRWAYRLRFSEPLRRLTFDLVALAPLTSGYGHNLRTNSYSPVMSDSVDRTPEVKMKACPFCGEEIRAAAILCRYCRSPLAPGAQTLGEAQLGAVGVRQKMPPGKADPSGAIAMLWGGTALLALAFLYLLDGVARQVALFIEVGSAPFREIIGVATGGGFVTFHESSFFAILFFVISISAALLLRGAERRGVFVWRAHPGIPVQTAAWVLAGLFLLGIVLKPLLGN